MSTQKLPKAPQGEGVDPLTDGNSYHGEDVKGNSTHQASASDVKGAKADQAKVKQDVADQKVAEKKADKAAEKRAK